MITHWEYPEKIQKQLDRGFRGSKRIRKAGIALPYTEEQQLEFARCRFDPLYFIENYVRIKHVDSPELILFKTRDYQQEMVDKIINNRETIIKLPRQCGKTSCVSALIVWHLIFNQNYAILCAAHKGDKARDVLSNVKEMYEELPPFLQQGVVEWSKGFIKLANGSRCKASATTASSARGDVYNMIYLDEFAFVETHLADEFVKSVMPTISSGETSKTVITSTPQGLNHFHTFWETAIQGKNRFKTVEIKWNDVPGRDEAFRDNIVATYGQAYFDQEYGAEFIGSGLTLIAGHVLKRMALDIVEPLNTNNKTRLFRKPEKERVYAITVDVAEGVGGDSSAVTVMDVTETPYQIALVYQNNEVDEVTFAGIVHDLGKAYNDALVLVESNFGETVGRILWEDFEYEYIVRTTRKKDRQTLGEGSQLQQRNGVKMDVATKRIGCNNLKFMVEQDQIKVVDDKTYNELKHFAVKGKSYAADQGHDDLAMCLVMFAWMVDQGYIKDLTDTNARKNIAEANRTTIENETLPFGFSVRTEEEMKTIEDPWTIPAEQARWLSDQGYDETFPWPTSAKIKADPAPDKRLPATKVLTDDELEWTWGGWRKPES